MLDYKGPPPSLSTKWKPMTIEQVLDFFAETEFSDIRIIRGNLGDEIDLFVNGNWAFSVIRIGNLYYVRKVGLRGEEWMAYATATGWAMPAVFITASWFWKYHIKKYGLFKTILLVFIPIIAWWMSGIISVMLFAPRIAENTYLMLIFSLYLGSLLGFILGGFIGLLTAFTILTSFLLPYWYFLWREELPPEELEELEEKWEVEEIFHTK